MKTRFDIRLIAMDLDGTLLTTDKRLTERNRSAMEKAAEAGITIVPATGRIYAGVPDEIKALPFIRYLILANGATVYDREEDRILYRAEIPPDKAIDVLDWLDGFPAIYDCYQDDRGYMTAEMWEKADREFSRTGCIVLGSPQRGDQRRAGEQRRSAAGAVPPPGDRNGSSHGLRRRLQRPEHDPDRRDRRGDGEQCTGGARRR